MTENEPDRTNRRPQIMSSDVQPKPSLNLCERAPIGVPKYVHLLIWIVMIITALLVVIDFLPGK
jgi:hypothetical protein